MSTEVGFLRDQVQRLNSALSHYQDRHRSQETSAPQGEEETHTETPAPWLADQSIMAPLLSEYDRHMDDMTEQLQSYQMQMTAIRLKLDTVVKENERLHAELRESVERQLQTLPVSTGPGVEGDTLGDEGLISNLHEQIQLSVQERDQAMELWQASAQELDRLQQLYQITTSDGQLHVAEQQRLKDQLIQFQQHIQKLQVTNQKLESVENVRKQCNSQIHLMAEEVSALQLECADKQSQMERSMREMRAVEEELEKVYKEGRGEPEYRKMEALHQRSLNAERLKDDMNITLQSTHNKMKKMEMDYSEELSRCQEEVRRLQGSLSAAREDCSGVSEERLQLQQENMQLRREMEELRKASMMTQRRATQQVSQMEQEYSLKEQGLDARVRELEESSRSSSADLTRLLSAQQKTSQRWKEEAKTLTLTFHTKLTSLKGELSRQKQRCQELEIQLVTDHESIVELSIMTSQRRKTSSMADLESL